MARKCCFVLLAALLVVVSTLAADTVEASISKIDREKKLVVVNLDGKLMSLNAENITFTRPNDDKKSEMKFTDLNVDQWVGRQVILTLRREGKSTDVTKITLKK